MIFVPKSSYSKNELIDCSQGNLFAPEHGRLPADEMLMFDCIKEIMTQVAIIQMAIFMPN